jgi:aspartyl-tRNA(Asn)/glutamyl-tRNA(Gln) amidotransferase subunit B
LRCDANISLRPAGTDGLGVKSELKNLNSFKAVKDALNFEIRRQAEILGQKESVIQETRLWDEKAGKTISMRSKEEAKDYRYFPEPDLPPFIISKEKIAEIRKTIPELPKERKMRFVKDYGLSEYDARILVSSKENADYAEERLNAYPDKKSVANWLIGPLTAIASSLNRAISEIKIPAKDFIELIDLVEKKQLISNLTGKAVLEKMAKCAKPPMEIIKEENLAQISDEQSLEKEVAQAIQENPKVVQDFKAGNNNSIMFLVGQVMKKTQGKANPKLVQDILKRRLQDA